MSNFEDYVQEQVYSVLASAPDWDERHAAHESEWACLHIKTELRYVLASNGVKGYRDQCLACGKKMAVRKADIPSEQLASIPPVDEELGRSWWKAKSQAWQEQDAAARQAEAQRWWAWYSEYLKSPQWRAIRQKVMARAQGVCEGCGERPPRQVHHLDYTRVGRELLFDLVAVCVACHQACHPNKKLFVDD